MSQLEFGNHVRLTAPFSERQRLQKFYYEVLGAEVIASSEKAFDQIKFSNNHFMGIVYSSETLSESESRLGAWLELKVRSDISNFYFQAPGGQIFRLTRKERAN